MAGDRARLRDQPALVASSVGLAVVERRGRESPRAPLGARARAPGERAGAVRRVPRPALARSCTTVVARCSSSQALLFFVARTAVTAVLGRDSRGPPPSAPPATARARPSQPRVDRDPRAVLLVPWVVLLFATAVFSLSWLFFVGVPVLVMSRVVMHQATVTTRGGGSGARRGQRRARAGERSPC